MQEINLLQNGDFAGMFEPFSSEQTLDVAAGWAPWWVPAQRGDPDWRHQMPVYQPFYLDGEQVQEVSSCYATHTGGLYQQVPAYTGSEYELSVDVQAWSSESEVPGSRTNPSDVNLQIGIDPTGGLDPASPLIQWSKPSQTVGKWRNLRLKVTAEANLLTIYLKSAPTAPKRQQYVFWTGARLSPLGSYRRPITVVGAGDTHLTFAPEQPALGESVQVAVSSTQFFERTELQVWGAEGESVWVEAESAGISRERYTWHYQFTPGGTGLVDVRFVAENGARLLARQLLRIYPRDHLAEAAEAAPSGEPRVAYRRVYVLLPPTATPDWVVAAARGSFEGRYTVGFSADDAGIGNLPERIVLAINPHHWPEALTAAWFHEHYPGTHFIPVVANSARDLEGWLRHWLPPE